MRIFISLFGALPVSMLLAPGPVHAAHVPAPDPAQGDGRVSSFYRGLARFPMRRGKCCAPNRSMRQSGWRWPASRSASSTARPTGLTARRRLSFPAPTFVPKGTPPAGGWPLVAWAHGTTGLADICAPSWNPRSKRDAHYLNTWLDQGYAVVATDYQGSAHPARTRILRCGRRLTASWTACVRCWSRFPTLANQIVIIGQSQGGQAAFATAGIAPYYAPELVIHGIVATGLRFLGSGVTQKPAPSDQANPTVAYDLYIGIMIQQSEPLKTAAELVTARALPLLEEARTTCVGQLFRDVVQAGLTQGNALAPGFVPAFTAVLPGLQVPIRPFICRHRCSSAPARGDHDVPPAGQLALVRNTCAQGSVVEAHLYAGLSHSETVNASLKDSVPFVRKVLAGEAIKPVCEPVAE